MKVLVIGGSGFIGSHVVDKLLAHGHSVRVFDRQPERFRAPLPGVDYRFGDFADTMALVEALTGVDAVYHLLSTTLPGTADLDPKTDVRDNLIGAINLLEFDAGAWSHAGFCSCRRAGLSMEYRRPFRFPETHALRPISSYGIVKASIEHYLEMYRRDARLLADHRARFKSIWTTAGAFRRPGRDLDISASDIGGRTCRNLGRRQRRQGLLRRPRSGGALRSRRNEPAAKAPTTRAAAMDCRSTRSLRPFAR